MSSVARTERSRDTLSAGRAPGGGCLLLDLGRAMAEETAWVRIQPAAPQAVSESRSPPQSKEQGARLRAREVDRRQRRVTYQAPRQATISRTGKVRVRPSTTNVSREPLTIHSGFCQPCRFGVACVIE